MERMSRAKLQAVGLLWVCLAYLGCAKGEPVLNDKVLLQVTISPASIYNFGDTALVTVLATEQDGRPVFDGARIQLTATAGSISNEVRTKDGKAEALFTSDALVGTVTITARSGVSGGEEGVSKTLEVLDRNVPIGAFALTLNPSNILNSGGQVVAKAIVSDTGGNPIANKAVVFSADYGSFANNGSPTFTDTRGVAQDTLLLANLPSELTSVLVSARVGDQVTEESLSVTTNQNPLPDFTLSPAAAREGETVYFDASLSDDPDGTIQAYQWRFGDGSSGTGKQAEHVYAQPGTFQVGLTVEDNRGATATKTQALTIGQNQEPVPDFSFSPVSPRIFELVSFNARSSRDPDGTIVKYEWDLGGIKREGAIVQNVFSFSGSFVINLTVTDNFGLTATKSVTLSIAGNQAPSASFSFSPTSPQVNSAVVFNAAGSSDPDGRVEQYDWSFGDGTRAEGVSPSHIYRESGNFQTSLIVRDNLGATAISTQSILVADSQAPTASFLFSPQRPHVATEVSFDASGSTSLSGGIESYQWSFGDGGSGSGVSVQHLYFSESSYLVSLTVRDQNGKEARTSQVVEVTRGEVPFADLTINPLQLTAPGGNVLLDATGSTDNESNLDQLRFSYRAFARQGVQVQIPAGTGPLRYATVSNALAGDQIVFHVEVTDQSGNTSFASATLEILSAVASAAPTARLSLLPGSLQEPGGHVVLDATATTDPKYDIGQLSFAYGFQTAGGLQVNLAPATGPLSSAQITQASAGEAVTFLLTASNPDGGLSTVTKTLILTSGASNTSPQANLSVSPSGAIQLPTNPGVAIQLSLDGRTSADAESSSSQLTYQYSWASLNTQLSLELQQVAEEPALALVSILGAVANDKVVFTLTVTDPGGLQDTASVIVSFAAAP